MITSVRKTTLFAIVIFAFALGECRTALAETSDGANPTSSQGSSGGGQSPTTQQLTGMIDQLQQKMNATNSSTDGSNNSSGSSNNSQNTSGTSSVPTITPPQPAQNSANQDRSSKNGAAQAAAVAGASMAMLSCMMMMNEAQKQKDPSTKNMMMMMAMQQCAQGAQDMANANQNGDGKQQLTADSTPKQAQLNTSPSKLPSTPSSNDSPLDIPSTIAQDDSKNSDLPPPTPLAQKPPPRPKNEEVPDEKPKEEPVDSLTKLSPIAQPKLAFDDNSKGGGVTPTAINGAPSFFGASNNLTPDQLKKLADDAAAKAAADGKDGRPIKKSEQGDAAGGGGGAGGGSEESGKSGEDPFQGMLGQLFGPKDGGEPLFLNGGAGAGDVLSLPDSSEATPGKRGPNIFEYASYRYRTLAYNEGRVRSRPLQRKPPGVKTAAMTH